MSTTTIREFFVAGIAHRTLVCGECEVATPLSHEQFQAMLHTELGRPDHPKWGAWKGCPACGHDHLAEQVDGTGYTRKPISTPETTEGPQ